jgi:transketolase
VSDNHSPYHYVRPEVIPLLNDGKLFSEGEKAPTRAAFAQTVIELGAANPDIVVLDADVSKSIGTNQFGVKFPERHFNFGIAEQNMFAAAAGMATTGLIPFACTYAVFASLRALDMVRNSIHYPNLNVKIAASHSGITPGPDGVTHQGQEDMTIMRSIANATVIAPADSDTTVLAVKAAAAYEGPVYLSFTRDPVPEIFGPDYPFEIGRAVTVREGDDVTIIAMRDLTAHALTAAAQLARDGIEARVIDCPTLKPLDEAVLLKAARETGAIVTAENNVTFGGLGSAVAELLVENHPIPMQRIGVRDTFAESGPYLDLLEKYGLSYGHIAKAARKVMARK